MSATRGDLRQFVSRQISLSMTPRRRPARRTTSPLIRPAPRFLNRWCYRRPHRPNGFDLVAVRPADTGEPAQAAAINCAASARPRHWPGRHSATRRRLMTFTPREYHIGILPETGPLDTTSLFINFAPKVTIVCRIFGLLMPHRHGISLCARVPPGFVTRPRRRAMTFSTGPLKSLHDPDGSRCRYGHRLFPADSGNLSA